jgi:hypothetical protein
MRTTSLLLVLSVAACSAPHTLERTGPVPLLQLEHPKADMSRDAGARADADRSPSLPSMPGPALTGEGAPVSFRSVVQVVEVPVASATNWDGNGVQGSYAADPQPGVPTSSTRSRRGGWFPMGTVVGAGIGAVIGNQSGNRGRGAFIGSNVGLLFDMARWFH